MINNKKHFLYNLLASYGNTVVTTILSFISVPIALSYWNKDIYGVWTILGSFAIYIAISGLGIESATGVLMTKNPNINIKIAILRKGVILLIFCSLIAALLIIVLTVFNPDWFRIIGKMDEVYYSVVKISVLIFTASIILNLPLNAFAYSLQAFGKAYVNTVIGTLQAISNFFILLLTVYFAFAFSTYVLFFSCNTLFWSIIKLSIVLIHLKYIRKKESVETVPTIAFDNHYSVIIKTGVNMSLYGAAVLLAPNLSNLIISNNIDVATVIPYSILYKLFAASVLFVTNMNIALAPVLGIEFGKDNWAWLTQTYKKMFYASVSLAVFLIMGTIWFGRPFIRIWTGTFENYPGHFISVALGFYFFVYILNNVNLVIINSFNYTNKIWLISWTECIIFILGSLLLVKKYGVTSIPLGLCFGIYGISSWAYPLVIYRRTLKRFFYDFNYLAKNIAIFILSITLYLITALVKLDFYLEIIVDCMGMLLTSFGIYLCLPYTMKQYIKNKLLLRWK